MVFGFARFIDTEVVVVAINFAHSDADFYVDCSPLAKIFTDKELVCPFIPFVICVLTLLRRYIV